MISGDAFDEMQGATIGVDYKSIQGPPKESGVPGESWHQNVKLQIWDTPHQERYREITKEYYKAVSVVVLVIDSTVALELGQIKKQIVEIKTINASCSFILAVTKIDMADKARINLKDLEESKTFGISDMVVTSAKTKEGIHRLHDVLFKHAVQSQVAKDYVSQGAAAGGVAVGGAAAGLWESPKLIGSFALQTLNGVGKGETKLTALQALDASGSRIWGGSVFGEFYEGIENKRTKHTDDKIVIGYTSQGLPFQIVVDGFFWGDDDMRDTLFQFIDTEVVSRMTDYSRSLTKKNSKSDELTTQLIRDIYEAREGTDNEFTMSLVMTYEKRGQLYAAGFGIGDTGIAVREASGDIRQLAEATYVSRVKDAFDSTTYNRGVDGIIDRNCVFNKKINPADEVIGYTFLHDGLISKESVSAEIRKDSLNHEMLNSEGSESFLDTVCRVNNGLYEERVAAVKGISTASTRFGDDCMIGTVKIPTPEVRAQIKGKFAKDEPAQSSGFLSRMFQP